MGSTSPELGHVLGVSKGSLSVFAWLMCFYPMLRGVCGGQGGSGDEQLAPHVE